MRGNDPRCVARSLILRKLRPLSRHLRVTYLHASATLCGSIFLLALRPPFPPAFPMSPTHAGPRPQPHALDPQRHPHPHPDPAEIRHPTAGAPCPGPPISGTTPPSPSSPFLPQHWPARSDGRLCCLHVSSDGAPAAPLSHPGAVHHRPDGPAILALPLSAGNGGGA